MPDEKMPVRAGATLDNALQNDATLNQGQKNQEGAKPDADEAPDATKGRGKDAEGSVEDEDEKEEGNDEGDDASEVAPPAGSP